jgi:hypothetical protein
MAWRLEGEYFENCSCSVMCPCIFHVNPDTVGRCDAGVAWHIQRGEFDGVRLDTLNVVAVFGLSLVGGVVGDMALYVDEPATPQQGESLGKIFTCKVGGELALIAPWISKVIGVRRVPIEYKVQGKVRSVSIPRILEMVIDPAEGGTVKGGPYLIEPPNCLGGLTLHPLYVVPSRKGTYTDYERRWDNTGKNGFYGKFAYSG